MSARVFQRTRHALRGGLRPVAEHQRRRRRASTARRTVLVLAWLGERPVGCGALKFHRGRAAGRASSACGSDSAARGLGIGRRLLSRALKRSRPSQGAQSVRLETNRTLTEAIALYRSAGYVQVPAFNDEPYAHHWFEKQLIGRCGCAPSGGGLVL